MHILLELCGRLLFFCFLKQPGAGLRRKIKRATDHNTGQIVLIGIVDGLAQGVRHIVGSLGVHVKARFLLQVLGAQCTGGSWG